MKHQDLSLQRVCVIVGSLLLFAGCASTASRAPVVERSSTSVTAPAPSVASARDIYTVKKGDTLYGIALDNGLDYKDLVSWNHLDNPNRILVGQQLLIRAPGESSSDVVTTRPITSASTIERKSLEANSDTFKREPKAGKEPYSEPALVAAQGASRAAESSPAASRAEPKVEQKGDIKPAGDEVAWGWPANGRLVASYSESTNKGVDIAGKAGDPVLAAGEGKVVYAGTGLRGYGKLVIVKHNNTFLSAYAHNQNVLVKEGQSVSKGQKIAEMGNTDADQVKLHFEVRREGKPVDPLKYLPPR